MDKPIESGSDFGNSYWRSPVIYPGSLAPVSAASVDDEAFRLLADNIPTLCWIANGDGYIFWYNRRWHEYCASTPAEMEGWGWQSVHDPTVLDEVMARWTSSISTGEPFEMTFPLRGADRVFRPFLTRVQPLHDASGNVVRWFGVNTDVSAQQLVESQLLVEQDRSQRVLAGMSEGFSLLSPDFVFLDINAEALRLDRRTREQMIGRSHWELYPGTENEALGKLYKHALAERVAVSLEHRHVWEDGRVFWLDMRAYPTDDGCLAVFFRDITDRHVAQQAAHESADRFEGAVRAFADILWTNDAQGRMAGEQPSWAALTGQSYAEYQGYGWSNAVHPDDAQPTVDAWEEAVAERRLFVFEHRVRRHDGVWRRFAIRAAPILNDDGAVREWVGVHRDITEHRANEARLRAVLDASPVGLVFADAPDGRITGGNTRAEEILGHEIYLSSDVEHYKEWVAFHLDGRRVEGHEYPLARAITGGENRPELEVRYQRGDGRLAYLRFIASPIVDEVGTITGGVVASLDIDKERRAELRQALFLQLADRLRLLDDPRAIIKMAIDLLGRHLGVARVGYAEITPDERQVVCEIDYADSVPHSIGTFPIEAFGHDNIAALRAGRTTFYDDATINALTRAAGGKTSQTRSGLAVPLVRDGRLRAALYVNDKDVRSWTAEEISLAEQVAARTWDALQRAAAEAQLRDLNETLERRVEERTAELRQTEEALRQAQKMEAVGQLTGGIAHDFNNMLAVVMGSLELLSRRTGTADARAKRYIDAASEGAKRAANLTQRLLAFSRQQPLQPEPLDVNRLVTGMSDILMHSLGGAVRLETVLAGGLWPVYADPNQLENVIVNLGINGRDAMPEGGKMTIETQNAHLDSRYAADEIGIAPGQYVLIAITDTGTGMPQEVINKAFDPFFTTKEVGKGTGLGLSQVYGFVKQSDGHVRIYSEVGQGTTIKLYLPRLHGHKPSSEGTELNDDLPRGESNELILVVEDEPAVRQFSTDALTELGYRVIAADSGESALRLLDEHDNIAMIFTDIVMPEMNGARLAELARQRRPGIPILFTTGYTRNAVVHNGVVDPGVELIGKPFTIEELAARVRAILDAQKRVD